MTPRRVTFKGEELLVYGAGDEWLGARIETLDGESWGHLEGDRVMQHHVHIADARELVPVGG